MENRKKEIAKFYGQMFLDTKLKEKIEEKAKAIVTEEDLRKLIREEIMPLMKKYNISFSEEELLNYEKEALKELSEESLENVSGGVSFKAALITGGVLSMALFGGGMLTNQNVTNAQVDPPVAQSTSDSEARVETQKKSYVPFRRYFNSAKNQVMNILGFLGQNRTVDEILNFLRELDSEALQTLAADANHLIPQIKELEGWGLYLYGAHSADFSVPSNDLQIILKLPGYISTVENEHNQVSINNVTEEGQDIIAAVTQVKGENKLAQETENVSQDEEIKNEVKSGALNSEENNTAHDEISASEAKDEIGSKETIAQTKEASVTSGTDKKEAHAEEAEVQASVVQAEIKDEVKNKEEVDSSKEASVTSETEEKSDDIKDETTQNQKKEGILKLSTKGTQIQSEESKNSVKKRVVFTENSEELQKKHEQMVVKREEKRQMIQKMQQKYRELADYLTSTCPIDEFSEDTKLDDKFGKLLNHFGHRFIIDPVGDTYIYRYITNDKKEITDIYKARIDDNVAEKLFKYAAEVLDPIYFDTTNDKDYNSLVNETMRCVLLNSGSAKNIIDAAEYAGIDGNQNLKKLLKALNKIVEQGTYDRLPQFMKDMISSFFVEANNLQINGVKKPSKYNQTFYHLKANYPLVEFDGSVELAPEHQDVLDDFIENATANKEGVFVNGVHIDNDVAKGLCEYISKTGVFYSDKEDEIVEESDAIMYVLLNDGNAENINYAAKKQGKDVKNLFKILQAMGDDLENYPPFITESVGKFFGGEIELGIIKMDT